MTAPSHHSHSLLDALRRVESDPAEAGGRGGRLFRRWVIRADAELHPMDRSRLDPTPREIKLRDIGRGGLGFIGPEPLPPGSSWRVCFLSRGYALAEQCILIHHCQRIEDGAYLCGGRFIASNGLLTMLGVEPSEIAEHEAAHTLPEDYSEFLSPDEVE